MVPEPTKINLNEEPFVKATIMTPTEYVGTVMDLCQKKRGTFKDLKYIEETRAVLLTICLFLKLYMISLIV